MKFYKYQAAGNDFIITETIIEPPYAAKLCDRHFGIGADGVLICTKEEELYRMTIINSDGSYAKMCGNGIRCFIKFLRDYKNELSEKVKILTDSGLYECNVESEPFLVSVNMGKPVVNNEISDKEFSITSVLTGNPHRVIIDSKLNKIEMKKAKELSEKYRFEGEEANAEVVTSLNIQEKKLSLIVNERGAGFTMACGTGGTAVMKALVNRNIAKHDEWWELTFPGGEIAYFMDSFGIVTMKADAEFVFEGIV